MRKILIIALALALLLTLAACGGGDTPSNSTTTPPASSGGDSITTPPSSTPDNAPSDDDTSSSSEDEAVDILALIGKTIDNERLVIVSNDVNDHLYGEESHYLFLTFNDEGKVDQFGDAGSYYIFTDEASFDIGLDKISPKGSNRTSLYIQGWTAYPNDWPNLTFAEIVERIETNSGQDNFSAVYDIVR